MSTTRSIIGYGIMIIVISLIVSACQHQPPVQNPPADSDIQSLDAEFTDISEADFNGGPTDEELGLSAQ